MDPMDLTNINNTISEEKIREAQIRQRLVEYQASTARLKEEVAADEARNKVILKRIEERTAQLNLFKQQREEKRIEALQRSREEAEKLKLAISLKQEKLAKLRLEGKARIDDLKKTLENLEKPPTALGGADVEKPPLDESTLTIEQSELMEKNEQLLEDNATIRKLIAEKDVELLGLNGKLASLQEKLKTCQENLSQLEMSLKESKENYQAKYDEKVRRESHLKQLNNPCRQGKSSKGGSHSLFDEVDQKTSHTAKQYSQLKRKYRLIDQVLDKNMKEISKLKIDSMTLKQTLDGKTAEKADINHCLEYFQNKRIKELEKYIETLSKSIENVQATEISSSNAYRIYQFAKASGNKIKSAEKEVRNMSMERLCLELRLSQVQSEVLTSKAHLKSLMQENTKLEDQIHKIEALKQVPESFEAVKKVIPSKEL